MILTAWYRGARERLRPQDFEGLTKALDFDKSTRGVSFGTATLNWIQCDTEVTWGTEVNFEPPEGEEPALADFSGLSMALTLRPLAPLRIENRILRTRLSERSTGSNIFTDTIIRSKWNWQFSREVSLRLIVQRNVTRAEPRLTSLESQRVVNADLLFSWQVNPWTALYVGLNGNAQNLELVDTASGTDAVRARGEWLEDSRQFFVKYSYLFQF